MTQIGYPLAGTQVTTPQDWSNMAQNWLGTGVLKGKLNELSVYADSTGLQVKTKSGQAFIQGHFFQSDAEVILPIANADSTNPRIDRVIVRLDYTSDSIQLAVLQGIPAVSPVAPALTQNSTRWEISLAQVYVGANVSTISTGNVTDERTFTGNRQKSYVEAYHSTGIVISANTWTKVPYQTEVTDLKSEFDPTLSRFTAKEAGEYVISASLLSAVSQNDAVPADMLLRKNGSDHSRLWGDTLKINKNTLLCGTTIMKLNAGDYIEIYFQFGGMGVVNPNTAPGALNSWLRINQVDFS